MFSSLKSVIIYFCVTFLLEFIAEGLLHIKSNLILKIGRRKYLFAVFGVTILLVIILNLISSKIFANSWVQGIFMGIWIFSIISIKHSKNKGR